MEIRRDAYLQKLVSRKNNGSTKVITGIRRSGKSYLLGNFFRKHLLESGVPEEQIVFVALDGIMDAEFLDPRRLYMHIADKAANGPVYAIIDEIQMMEKFPLLVNDLMRIEGVDLYVTGSNSHMLSSDVLTEFRGRGDEIHVLPLTFSEFRQAFDGTDGDALREYLRYGGMPEVLNRHTHEEKSTYLNNLVKKVYLDDIVDRNSVRLVDDLDNIFDDLCSSVGSLTNPSKIAHALHSEKGSSIDDNTVRNYLAFMEEAYLFESAKRFDVKGKRYFKSLAKYYIADVGLRNARLNYRQLDDGHLMENVIYNELRARGMSVDVGMVEAKEQEGGKRSAKQLEVDFVATDGNAKYYIQSALRLDSDAVIERESRPFGRINDSFKKIIITRDTLMRHYDDNGVVIMGLIDFLLDKASLS